MHALLRARMPQRAVTADTGTPEKPRRYLVTVLRAREDFAAMAAVLERHLERHSLIVGDFVTAADCVTANLMDWANEQGLLAGLPNLQAYLARIYDRPAAPQRIAAATANIRAPREVTASDNRQTRAAVRLILGGL